MLPAIIVTMNASDQPMGKCPSQLAGYQLTGIVILTPTNTSTMPRPYFSMWNLSAAPASRKYRLRRPRIANTLLVNTMNGSLVTAKIAGTLSTANTMSLTSIMQSATKSGVPTQRSAFAPVPPDVLERHGTAWIKPANLVCNGSYTLEDWRIDDHIRLKRNPGYWDAANVPIGTIEVKPVPDANTALNLFHAGQCDLIMDKGMVPASLAGALKKQPWFHTAPLLGTWFIRFNTTRAPFTDARVRQAFALAVDKRRIVQDITQLGETAADSLTPPGTGHGYVPPPGLAHDVARARQLLAEAGFPDGKGFPLVEYLYIPQPVERSIAVELQAMWQKNLGVTVNLKKQEQKIWLSSMRQLDYDLCRSSWVGDYNDPGTFLDLFLSESGTNYTGWKNADYDALRAAAAREPDEAKRNAHFARAEQLLIREHTAILPVYFYVGIHFYRDRLTGIHPNLIDDHPFRCMRWR